jgi:hypothetical protein
VPSSRIISCEHDAHESNAWVQKNTQHRYGLQCR